MDSEKRYQLRINFFGFFIAVGTDTLPTVLIAGTVLLIAVGIFLQVKLFSVVFAIAIQELGISAGLGVALWVLAICCFRVHIPLCLVTSPPNSKVNFYELAPVWLLKRKDPSYQQRFRTHSSIAISLVGGLIPVVLALYQFSRQSPLSILGVTAIVATMSYFFATVVPGRGIYFRWHQLWIAATAAALSALSLSSQADDSAAAIAFSGSVLGTLIGADLLHLGEAQRKAVGTILSIGGAGFKDGIVRCGLVALLLAEWVPYGINFLKS